ncbi:MAG: histidine phosphatase family protein [Polyangiales bacterium]
MQVLLVRHGQAIDIRSTRTDHDRWLTDAGRKTVNQVGQALVQLGLQYSCIYTSPLVRSVQTAEILTATHPDFRGPVKVEPALSIDEGTTAEALQPLEHAGDDELIVMVTHMPKVAVLAGHLCAISTPPKFRTASACLVSLDRGRGRLQWMLDPKTLELRRH